MAILSKPSSAARMALMYITLGSLILVWSAIWYWWLMDTSYEGTVYRYVCTGLLLTGGVLLFIGLALGRIGRAARRAELPPAEVTPAAAQIDQTAAQAAAVNAPVAAPVANSAVAGQPAVVVPRPVNAPAVAPAAPVQPVPAAPRLQEVPPVE
jgi:hypothetical protein